MSSLPGIGLSSRRAGGGAAVSGRDRGSYAERRLSAHGATAAEQWRRKGGRRPPGAVGFAFAGRTRPEVAFHHNPIARFRLEACAAMLVSILIPCYNAARWIEQAIESALAQS